MTAADWSIASRSSPPPRWVGELYLELHQGTLTSQALIKKQNRLCESMFRSLEAALVAVVHSTSQLPVASAELAGCMSKIKELWKILLLNQFHDVIRE